MQRHAAALLNGARSYRHLGALIVLLTGDLAAIAAGRCCRRRP